MQRHATQPVGACLCGGARQHSLHSRVTPRQWLDQRWQRQAAGNSRCITQAAAAATGADRAVLPPGSFLTTHSGTNSSSRILWDDLVIHIPHQQHQQKTQQLPQPLLAKPVIPEQLPQVPAGPANTRTAHCGGVERIQQLHQLQQPPDALKANVANGVAAARQPHKDSHMQSVQQQQQQPAALSSSFGQGSSTTSSSSRQSRLQHSEQLMQAIKHGKSIHALTEVYYSSKAYMDHVHYASMLNRLAHTWDEAQREHSSRKLVAKADIHSSQQQQSPPMQAQQQQLKVQYEHAVSLLEALLRDMTAHHLPSCKVRELSSCLWVIGKFASAAASSSSIQQAAAALLQQLVQPTSRTTVATGGAGGRMKGSTAAAASAVAVHSQLDVSSSSSSLDWQLNSAAAGGSSRQLLHGEQQQQQQQQHLGVGQAHSNQGRQQPPPLGLMLHAANMTDLSNILCALGRLAQVLDVQRLFSNNQLQQQPPPPEQQQQQYEHALCLLEAACCQQLITHSSNRGQFVATTLVGFAHLQRPVPALFTALVRRLGFNFCKDLQSQHVVMTSWALAKLGHYDKPLAQRLLWRAVVVRQALEPRGVALLLWAAAKAGHEADPRAVAQLLQRVKQPGVKLRGKNISLILCGVSGLGLLQQHKAWVLGDLLQQVLLQLHTLQPVGVATVLRALLELLRTEAAAAAAAAVAAKHQQAVPTIPAGDGAVTQLQLQQHHSGLLGKRLQASRSSSNISSSSTSTSGNSSSSSSSSRERSDISQHHPAHSCAVDSRQLMPLCREMSRHIAAQLPATTPQTLYNILVALAGLGYYDARLYSKIATALAAAAAHPRSRESAAAAAEVGRHDDEATRQQQQQQFGPFGMQHSVRLLCLFAHFQHPAPALWSALLPPLAAASSSSSSAVHPRQLVQLLAASTAAGCPADFKVAQGLLQLALLAIEHQSYLQFADLVLLSAAGSTSCTAVLQQQQQCCDAATLHQLAHQLDRQLRRLVPRLVSAVLSQPQLLPMQYLPQLLQAAVQLQQTSSSSRTDSVGADYSGSSSQLLSQPHMLTKLQQQPQHYPHQTISVGHRQLQRLADSVIEQLGNLSPSALVTMLHLHTQPPLYDPVLAEAYAEELLCRLQQCNCAVQTLVQLLGVLAAAAVQPSGYSHSQLLAVALRVLHGKLLLATEGQLQDAMAALGQLQQQQSPVYRAAARMLEC